MEKVLFSEMNQDELLLVQNTKEGELRKSNDNLGLVEREDIRLSKSIIELQLERKNNQLMMSKAKFNVKSLMSELREIRNRYWQNKNG